MGRLGSGGEARVSVGVGARGESTADGTGSKGGNRPGGGWGARLGNDWSSGSDGGWYAINDGKLELGELRERARGQEKIMGQWAQGTWVREEGVRPQT